MFTRREFIVTTAALAAAPLGCKRPARSDKTTFYFSDEPGAPFVGVFHSGYVLPLANALIHRVEFQVVQPSAIEPGQLPTKATLNRTGPDGGDLLSLELTDRNRVSWVASVGHEIHVCREILWFHRQWKPGISPPLIEMTIHGTHC